MNWSEADLARIVQQPGYRVVGADAPVPLPGDTPEGTLLAKIRTVAKAYGWHTYHVFDARRSEAGYPDLTLCDGKSLLMYELKSNTGQLTEEQALWLSLLTHTEKVECGVWRPRDFGQIYERLTRRNHA